MLQQKKYKFGVSEKYLVLFLLGVATLECLRHQARWFILTVRIKYHARCLRHSRVATPNRGTNIPFLSTRNTNLDYWTNAWSFFLLGVATLKCLTAPWIPAQCPRPVVLTDL